MPIALLLPNYLLWHYSKGLKEMLQIWGNLLYFTVYFFSIPSLLLSLFSPWRRLNEAAQKTINVTAIMEHVIFNTLMRVIGFFFRSVTVIVGLIAVTFVIIAGFGLFLLWLVMPLLLIALIAAGIMFIIKPAA